MRWRILLAVLFLAVPGLSADTLPDLGDAAQAGFSPLQERRLGESIMRDIRADRRYFDDVEATDYLNSLGGRLVAQAPGVRQEFDFFLIRDRQINAFALPGGFIGMHTGLVLAAQSESEVASVLGHEIAHVTQRHIARMIAQHKQSQTASLAVLAAAILLSRVDSQAGQAAIAFGQAGLVQSHLNFSRDHEREADRIGLQLLERAGFDPRAMAVFFERLQRATRVYESGAPSYLRTHPLTFERIADIQSRTQSLPYRQVRDSIEFQLIRAKLRAYTESPPDAVAFFEASLAERKFLSEAAGRYGLTASLVRAGHIERARKELAALRSLVPSNPIVETLACTLAVSAGDGTGAISCYETALKAHPGYRALVYGYAEALLDTGEARAALRFIDGRSQAMADDYRLFELKARAHAALDQRLAQYRAQAEAYVRRGEVSAAVEQLTIGLKSGHGDFFELSSAEARLRELRRLDEDERRDGRR
jgi:beta-barrel assembly-enhancing protease